MLPWSRACAPAPAAGGHDFALPEVTFGTNAIATVPWTPQHGCMHETLRKLLQPLNLAALGTLVAVGLSLRWISSQQAALGWSLLLAYTLILFADDFWRDRRALLRHVLIALQGMLALVLIALDVSTGVAPVLLVVWAAVISGAWPLRVAIPAIVAADILYYWILRADGHSMPLRLVVIYAGFQAFAALCVHYARSAEHTRDQLALVNADLLATRALLADAARDAERVRVARELHDVAGHKLTAMTLNLRALATDPAFAARDEVRIAQQLSSELLGDIRNVVQALRDSRGLDLTTALRALAAPLPKPALLLRIDDDVRIDDPLLAEALLRIVQEALTNAARHAGANTLTVSLLRDGSDLRLALEDDSQVRGPLRPGNGLTGMRERIESRGGAVDFAIAAHGGLRILARLPT